MKPITVHPFSLLAGISLAGLVLLASGAAQTAIPSKPIFVGEVPAEWWTFVEINPTQSFTVPNDRHLVVTLAYLHPAGDVYADGENARTRLIGVWGDLTPYGVQLGNGTRVVFEPGTTLTSTGTLSAWGYLQPLR